MSIYSDLISAYEKAAETLAGKVIDEPYNFHQIAGLITNGLLKTEGLSGSIIETAAKQYKEKKEYSAHTIARFLHIETSYIYDLANKDEGIDLSTAFSFFSDLYGQKVEMDIAQNVEGLVYRGETSEQIRIKSDQMRKESGLVVRNAGSDGKDEFEQDLQNAIEGRVINYPIKPPIVAMRKIVRHHEPGEYIVIGGRTGMGKSFIGLNYMYSAS